MSLPTRQRIRRPAEFRRVFAHGRRASNALANVVVLPNDLDHMRVGLSVSKQVGSAVTRNQVKRRIRNAFVGMNIVDGWDIVVIAKPGSSSASYSELDGAILKLVQRLGIQFASTESPVETGAVV